MAAPHSAWHGRGGSWKAPCSQLVCGEGRDGRSPRCFQQEQNSRSAWMPFGVRLELGRGRCWSSALAEESGPGVPQVGLCQSRGAREGRMEAGGSSWRIGVTPIPPGVTTASLHSRTVPAPVSVPFHFGRPPCPLRQVFEFEAQFVPPRPAPAVIPDPAHRPHHNASRS